MEFNVSDIVIEKAIETAIENSVRDSVTRGGDFQRALNGKLTAGVQRASLSGISIQVEEAVTGYLASGQMDRLIKDAVEREIKSSFSNAFKGAIKAIAVAKAREYADTVTHEMTLPHTPPDQKH
ncbi:MAG: hypothetical protein ACPGPF_00070 [Pontibacterium sp.]